MLKIWEFYLIWEKRKKLSKFGVFQRYSICVVFDDQPFYRCPTGQFYTVNWQFGLDVFVVKL